MKKKTLFLIATIALFFIGYSEGYSNTRSDGNKELDSYVLTQKYVLTTTPCISGVSGDFEATITIPEFVSEVLYWTVSTSPSNWSGVTFTWYF